MPHTPETKDVQIRLGWFALVTAFMPLLTIHTTYLVSAMQGHVYWCIPYIQSCTSISATGRDGAGYFIFKGVMVPIMTLFIVFWFLTHRWLQGLGYRYGKGVGWLGLFASLFLILYTVALGHRGDEFHLMRRIGVTGYFGMTGIAQILAGSALYRSSWPLLQRSGRRLVVLTALTLTTAMVSLVWQSVPTWDYDPVKHSFEWILIMMLNFWGIGMAILWHKAGLSITLPRAVNLQ